MTGTITKKLVFGGFVITFIGAIFFSTKAIFVKLAFANTPTDAVTLLALRMFFALPFYIAIGLFASNKKSNVYFTSRQWLYIILLGLTGYYVSSLCDFIGLQYISAGLERLMRLAGEPDVSLDVHDRWLRGQNLLMKFEPESWQRQSDHRRQRCQPVEPAAAADRRPDADRHRQRERAAERRAHQLQRRGHTFENAARDRPPVAEAVPPITLDEGREP